MKGQFNSIIKTFPELLDKLEKSSPLSRSNLLTVPSKGIYIFYNKDGRPLYVGRTDRMRTRLLEHGRSSSRHTSATFAFLLAKEKWDEMHPGDARTRKDLESDQTFFLLYKEKKRDVAEMQIRTIEVADPAEQVLFEVYAALELETPYNDWENH